MEDATTGSGIAKRVFQPHGANPRAITADKNPACPRAAREMKRAGRLWRFSRLRQCKYFNNAVEQDYRRIECPVRPGLGFGSLRTARRTLAGYQAMAMIKKGPVQKVSARDVKAQAAFIAGLFGVAASQPLAYPDAKFATEPAHAPHQAWPS